MWCVRVTWNFLMNIDIYMDFILIVLALLIRNGNPVSLLEMEIETIAPGRRGFLRSPHPFFRNSVVSFICPFMFTYFFFLCSVVSSWFGLVWFGLVCSHTIENSIDLQNEVYWLGRQILFIYFHLQFYERAALFSARSFWPQSETVGNFSQFFFDWGPGGVSCSLVRK